MSWEVVIHSIERDPDAGEEAYCETEEVYTTCDTEEEAQQAVALLRRSMLPLVIVVRQKDEEASL